MRRDDIGEKKKMDRYHPPVKGTRIRYSHIRCEFPAGTRCGGDRRKIIFSYRARGIGAHTHTRSRARMIRRVGRLPLPLVPRCLFLFFRPLRRHPVSSSSRPPIPHCRRYRPSAPPSLSGMHAAPCRPLFCFPLFSGFSGRAAPDTRAANRWCAAQQVADYKNHSATPGAC